MSTSHGLRLGTFLSHDSDAPGQLPQTLAEQKSIPLLKCVNPLSGLSSGLHGDNSNVRSCTDPRDRGIESYVETGRLQVG